MMDLLLDLLPEPPTSFGLWVIFGVLFTFDAVFWGAVIIPRLAR